MVQMAWGSYTPTTQKKSAGSGGGTSSSAFSYGVPSNMQYIGGYYVPGGIPSGGSKTAINPNPSRNTASGGSTGSGVVSQPGTSSISAPSGGKTSGGYGSGFNWQDWMPGLPQDPQVTSKMLADWLARATQEAGLMYDPQLLSINQELQKALLASGESKGAISPYYEDVIKAIEEWQTKTTAEEQRRHYARGFGRSGVLLEQEQEISEKALGETTKAETEKARILTDIEKQETLLKQQAGEKRTGIEAARGQYISARQSELRDSYEQNQQVLAQQKFANQMQIAQFGLTAESQAFSQYLAQSELSLDTWYKESLINLEKESMSMDAAALSARLAQGSGGTEGLTPYQLAQMELANKQLTEEQRQFNIQNQPKAKTTADMLREAQDLQAWRMWGLGSASTGVGGNLTPTSTATGSSSNAWPNYNPTINQYGYSSSFGGF